MSDKRPKVRSETKSLFDKKLDHVSKLLQENANIETLHDCNPCSWFRIFELKIRVGIKTCKGWYHRSHHSSIFRHFRQLNHPNCCRRKPGMPKSSPKSRQMSRNKSYGSLEARNLRVFPWHRWNQRNEVDKQKFQDLEHTIIHRNLATCDWKLFDLEPLEYIEYISIMLLPLFNCLITCLSSFFPTSSFVVNINTHLLHCHQADAELKTSSLAATEDALAKLGTSHSPYQLGTPRGAMNFHRVWRSPFCFGFHRGCWAVGCILLIWSSAETEEMGG